MKETPEDERPIFLTPEDLVAGFAEVGGCPYCDAFPVLLIDRHEPGKYKYDLLHFVDDCPAVQDMYEAHHHADEHLARLTEEAGQ